MEMSDKLAAANRYLQEKYNKAPDFLSYRRIMYGSQADFESICTEMFVAGADWYAEETFGKYTELS